MLDADNVHTTVEGAKALYSMVSSSVPELNQE
jgi:hypothetical protein